MTPTSADEDRIKRIFFQYTELKTREISAAGGRFVYYTTAETATCILRNKQIWMRSTAAMNDYLEVEHGFDCLNASYKAAPWYKITLLGMYIGDTTKNGNTVGSARKANGLTLRDDTAIGWEVGLYNEFQIYKNLTFNVAGGWLFAGKALDYWNPTTSKNVGPKDPYLLGTMLKYTW